MSRPDPVSNSTRSGIATKVAALPNAEIPWPVSTDT
jgi:hypothetical protein